MCGICGVVQIGGEPRPVVPPHVLDRMTDVMEHRGPDDRGTYAAAGVALGARRLSIVDVAAGHQPFANEDRTVWAIQNGELYNHPELRIDLAHSGHSFATRCDSEVLPHLYEQYGARYPEALRGKFATAVWDGKRRRLVLARDRLGVKPLYYARRGGLFVFASELKSVLASGLVDPQLDYEAIDAYLTLGFVPGPSTPLAGVSKLPPGHRLVVDAGGVEVERYWAYPLPAPVESSEGEHAERLLAVLEESVRLRLMSDVPIGVMLSGGLDSSLVLALMARNTSESVRTFSIGFAEAGPGNELADAREVAARFGAEHHEIELSLADADVDLADLVWFLDEPLADLSALGFLALSQLAARHVTVALSGQGADELLGGYSRHRNAALAARLHALPRPIRTTVLALAARGPARARKAARVLGADDPVTLMLAMKSNLRPALRRRLLHGPLASPSLDGALAAVRARADGLNGGDALAATLAIDAQLGLVDDMLHYFDRASMTHSLEVRVPFLDHRVVEYCATIPSALKVRGMTTKYVLKHAARGLLPDRIVDKQKIGFFNSAVAGWFHAQADGPISDYLLSDNPRYASFLDRAVVAELVARHTAGAHEDGDLLLSILMLELWLSTYLQRALVPPTAVREQIRIPA